MTEHSMLWTTGTVGDGATGYDMTQTTRMFKSLFGDGVVNDYLNELVVSSTASPISVATGAAWIQGVYYHNDAAKSLTLATPSVGTTGFRVVIRADWGGEAAETVTPPLHAATNKWEARLVMLWSADGTATIPAAQETAGDIWDESLATGTITTAGVVALTDARTYSVLNNAELATATIANNAVTAAKIADRTRTFFIPATRLYNEPWTALAGDTNQLYGIPLPHGSSNFATGVGSVPNDFVSGLTAKAVIRSSRAASTGNMYYDFGVYSGAIGEVVSGTSYGGLTLAVVAALPTLFESATKTISDAAIGDYLLFTIDRNGNEGADTCLQSISVLGFLVSYTADS